MRPLAEKLKQSEITFDGNSYIRKTVDEALEELRSDKTRYSRSSDDAPVIQYARKGPSKWLDGVEYPWSEKRGEYGRWSRANGRPFYRSYEDAVKALAAKKKN